MSPLRRFTYLRPHRILQIRKRLLSIKLKPPTLSSRTTPNIPRTEKTKTTWASTLRVFSITLLYLLAPSLYLTRNHYAIYSITGSSMSPTLSPHASDAGTGDWVLFRKRIILPGQQEELKEKRTRQATKDTREESWIDGAEVKRGSIVSFHTPHSPDKIAVKRVIALPGDVVTPLVKPTSAPLVAPTAASECPRNAYGPALALAEEKESQVQPITVPFGHVWVEGDNPYRTWDSNDYGPLSSSLITGVARAVVLPWDRRGVPLPQAEGTAVDGAKRGWEEDGWRDRVNGRVQWKEDGYEAVPEEWAMN